VARRPSLARTIGLRPDPGHRPALDLRHGHRQARIFLAREGHHSDHSVCLLTATRGSAGVVPNVISSQNLDRGQNTPGGPGGRRYASRRRISTRLLQLGTFEAGARLRVGATVRQTGLDGDPRRLPDGRASRTITGRQILGSAHWTEARIEAFVAGVYRGCSYERRPEGVKAIDASKPH
jgi:hypothetical protein